jgi:hypothetical protein
MTERVWTLHLNHSDLIEIYNTTSDAIIKQKIENHFLADKMSNWKNWVPSDTKNLEMLRSAASALESTASELRSINRELSLTASALESTASDLTLAVSRLTSRPKKNQIGQIGDCQ